MITDCLIQSWVAGVPGDMQSNRPLSESWKGPPSSQKKSIPKCSSRWKNNKMSSSYFFLLLGTTACLGWVESSTHPRQAAPYPAPPVYLGLTVLYNVLYVRGQVAICRIIAFSLLFLKWTFDACRWTVQWNLEKKEQVVNYRKYFQRSEFSTSCWRIVATSASMYYNNIIKYSASPILIYYAEVLLYTYMGNDCLRTMYSKDHLLQGVYLQLEEMSVQITDT